MERLLTAIEDLNCIHCGLGDLCQRIYNKPWVERSSAEHVLLTVGETLVGARKFVADKSAIIKLQEKEIKILKAEIEILKAKLAKSDILRR